MGDEARELRRQLKEEHAGPLAAREPDRQRWIRSVEANAREFAQEARAQRLPFSPGKLRAWNVRVPAIADSDSHWGSHTIWVSKKGEVLRQFGLSKLRPWEPPAAMEQWPFVSDEEVRRAFVWRLSQGL